MKDGHPQEPGRWLNRLRGRGKAAAGAVVINAAPVANQLTDHALTAIAGYGVKACPVIVHQRIEHVHAFTAGLSASESVPSGKAAAEINELFEWTRSRDQW